MFPSMRFSWIRVFEAVCDPPPLDNGSDTAYIKRFQENRACPAVKLLASDVLAARLGTRPLSRMWCQRNRPVSSPCTCFKCNNHLSVGIILIIRFSYSPSVSIIKVPCCPSPVIVCHSGCKVNTCSVGLLFHKFGSGCIVSGSYVAADSKILILLPCSPVTTWVFFPLWCLICFWCCCSGITGIRVQTDNLMANICNLCSGVSRSLLWEMPRDGRTSAERIRQNHAADCLLFSVK